MSDESKKYVFPTAGVFNIIEGERAVPRADLKIQNLTMAGFEEWVRLRAAQIQQYAAESFCKYHLGSLKDDPSIMLVVGQHGRYASAGAEVIPMESIQASARMSDELARVREYLDNGDGFSWKPMDLAKQLRSEPDLYVDEQSHTAMVRDLQSFQATVNKLYADTTNDTGTERIQKVEARIADPKITELKFSIPLITGGVAQEVVAKVLYDAEFDGVKMTLVSPKLNRQVYEAKRASLDQLIAKVRSYTDGKVPILEGYDKV